MYKFTIFALLAALFCLAAASPYPEQQCKPGEALYPCGLRCEKHCGRHLPNFCLGARDRCGPVACGCRRGLERHPINGRCVNAYQCPRK